MKTTNEMIAELEKVSEVVSPTLWYVNPRDLESLIESERAELREAVEKYVKGENEWDKRQPSDKFCGGALNARSKMMDKVLALIDHRPTDK